MVPVGDLSATAVVLLGRRASEWLAWIVLAVILIFNVPLFLCMPLWPDTTLYDVCARNILSGGVHYRDVFDNNFPGIVWLHVLIRSLLGWSHEAIRLVDLLFLTGSLLLLANWLKLVGRSRAVQVWTVALCFLFYFSTTEMCHCQRDPWAFLPALAGLSLRCRQVSRLAAPSVSAWRTLAWAAMEGVCWGAAVWIKPQFMVPAFTCWLMSALQIARASSQGRLRLLSDLAGLLCGGLLTGGVGIAWLMATGAWPAFLDIFLDWNREYLLVSRRQWGVTWLVWRLRPWGLVHLVAMPVALVILFQGIKSRGRRTPAASLLECTPALLAALYLGWVLQVLLLQQGFDYHRVPAMLLGLTLLIGAGLPSGRVGWAVLAGFLVWAALHHPMLHANRATAWPLCVRYGSTPELRDRLTMTGVVNSTELRPIRDYLAKRHLKPGELTSYDWRTNLLYVELGLKPSTRFVTVDSTLLFYPGHRDIVLRELNKSHQHYVVTDLETRIMTDAEMREVGPDKLPPAFPPQLRKVFPWSEPIVFRSGRYLVHRVTGPVKVLVPGTGEHTRHDQD
jgi:hypothetical protein